MNFVITTTGKVRRRDKRVWFMGLAVFVAVFLFIFLMQRFKGIDGVEAANLAEFDAGYIISDYQMGNYNSMSEAEIQAFLTAKNPCDNRDYGYYQRLSGNYNYSWHFENGHFVCLSEERFGDGDNEIGFQYSESAAHIIWQAAQDYRINPQVLIVLLQKETGLITDRIPNNGDYRKATGYGCPDTAACSSKYYGFKNQVRNAAALYRYVLDNGSRYYPTGNTYVQYNPNAGCGGSVVNIRNRATSALYQYTPYQPNGAALAAGYGAGDGCSAYGNRNFYSYFEDWFGGAKNEGINIQDLLANTVRVPDEVTAVGFEQNAFIQSYGWGSEVEGGKMIGTTGYGLRIEGMTLKLNESLGIEYRVHLQDRGWESVMKRDGEISGAPGSGLRMEAIQIRLYGDLSNRYDVYYRVHVQDIGWMDWVENGAVAGTTGRSLKIEAIQIKILEKPSYVSVEYSAHVQDIGWMDWVENGAVAGTTGRSKRVEAIQIKLKDGLENRYDVYYRVHVQDIGWMDWVENGAVAGTTGRSKRVEAIQIKLVNK